MRDCLSFPIFPGNTYKKNATWEPVYWHSVRDDSEELKFPEQHPQWVMHEGRKYLLSPEEKESEDDTKARDLNLTCAEIITAIIHGADSLHKVNEALSTPFKYHPHVVRAVKTATSRCFGKTYDLRVKGVWQLMQDELTNLVYPEGIK